MLFNGIAQAASRTDISTGVQGDGSWRINDQHTLRAGFLEQIEHATSATTSSVLPVNAAGEQTSTQPLSIIANQNNAGVLYGVYAQDEWHIVPKLTLNYGLRFDAVECSATIWMRSSVNQDDS
jgi:outer membrane receptor protein involved in Fe transport